MRVCIKQRQLITSSILINWRKRRQRGRVVRASDLKTGGLGFKSRSDHYLYLFLCSPMRDQLLSFNLSAPYQLGVLIMLCCIWNSCFFPFVSLSLKSPFRGKAQPQLRRQTQFCRSLRNSTLFFKSSIFVHYSLVSKGRATSIIEHTRSLFSNNSWISGLLLAQCNPSSLVMPTVFVSNIMLTSCIQLLHGWRFLHFSTQ